MKNGRPVLAVVVGGFLVPGAPVPGAPALAEPIAGARTYLDSSVERTDEQAVVACFEQLSSEGIPFVSGESRAHDGQRVVNRVWRGQAPTPEVWCMAQHRVSEPETKAALLAIIVTTNRDDKVASFLQVSAGARSGKFASISPKAPCLMCHSNGPRAIRPEVVHGLPAPSMAERERIRLWNIAIAKSGVIRGFDARAAGNRLAAPISASRPASNEALTLPACSDCHSAASGVRGPLKRENAPSISFLLEKKFDQDGWGVVREPGIAAMPRIGHELTAQETVCLTAWIEGRGMALDCLSADMPEAGPGAVRLYGKDGPARQARANLSIVARVKTTLRDFNLDGFGGELQLRGQDQPGTFTGYVDLARLRSGIALRDRHMHKEVIGREIRALVRGNAVAIGRGRWRLDANLSWRRREAKIHGDLVCDGNRPAGQMGCRCAAEFTAVDIRQFGVQPPSILWVEVRPEIDFSLAVNFEDSCPS